MVTDTVIADLVASTVHPFTTQRQTEVLAAACLLVTIGLFLARFVANTTIAGLSRRTFELLTGVHAGLLVTGMLGAAVRIFLTHGITNPTITGLLIAALYTFAIQGRAMSLIAALLIIAFWIVDTKGVANTSITYLAIGAVELCAEAIITLAGSIVVIPIGLIGADV